LLFLLFHVGVCPCRDEGFPLNLDMALHETPVGKTHSLPCGGHPTAFFAAEFAKLFACTACGKVARDAVEENSRIYCNVCSSQDTNAPQLCGERLVGVFERLVSNLSAPTYPNTPRPCTS
jgi:hypothetical protein